MLPRSPSTVYELRTTDFLHDVTTQGWALRIFGAIDIFSRECVAPATFVAEPPQAKQLSF